MNSNLEHGDSNHVLLDTLTWINSYKKIDQLDHHISALKEAIKAFKEHGVEIGLCVKYDSSTL